MLSPWVDLGSGAPNPGRSQPVAAVAATAAATSRHTAGGRRTGGTVVHGLRSVVRFAGHGPDRACVDGRRPRLRRGAPPKMPRSSDVAHAFTSAHSGHVRQLRN